MPMSPEFEQRLLPHLEDIIETFGTPFHIYDETGITDNCRRLKELFGWNPGYREFFAVKALPNPRIMQIMMDEGFGFDCSSIPELLLARQVEASPEDIIFTSNNTGKPEFDAVKQDGGCILNLDDISMIDQVEDFPELIFFRYNPGASKDGNDIIGKPVEAKFGIRADEIADAYRRAIDRGARRFGLHTMVCSNVLDYGYYVDTVRMLLNLVARINKQVGIRIESINTGGGIGIPYRPKVQPFDLESLAEENRSLYDDFEAKHGYAPNLLMELGRFMGGPHGVLVATVINRMSKYREYVGVDASMSSLMRPGIYGSYHHITVPGKEGEPRETVDVVGSLCENIDKFAIQRDLPRLKEGDHILIHDTGAHGYAMGFNYNGSLRPQELLLRTDGSVELIRRAETPDDYFATLQYEEKILPAKKMQKAG